MQRGDGLGASHYQIKVKPRKYQDERADYVGVMATGGELLDRVIGRRCDAVSDCACGLCSGDTQGVKVVELKGRR